MRKRLCLILCCLLAGMIFSGGAEPLLRIEGARSISYTPGEKVEFRCTLSLDGSYAESDLNLMIEIGNEDQEESSVGQVSFVRVNQKAAEEGNEGYIYLEKPKAGTFDLVCSVVFSETKERESVHVVLCDEDYVELARDTLECTARKVDPYENTRQTLRTAAMILSGLCLAVWTAAIVRKRHIR